MTKLDVLMSNSLSFIAYNDQINKDNRTRSLASNTVQLLPAATIIHTVLSCCYEVLTYEMMETTEERRHVDYIRTLVKCCN